MLKEPIRPFVESASFTEQLHHYMGRLSDGQKSDRMTMAALAETIDLEGVGKKDIQDIAGGKRPPTMTIARAIADALMIEREARTAFFTAALAAQPLSSIIRDHAAAQGKTSNRAMASLFGVSDGVMQRILADGAFKKRRDAFQFADELELTREQQRHFLRRFGNYFLDDQQLFEALAKKEISLADAIKGLCDIRGWERQEAYEPLGIPASTHLAWTATKQETIPPRKYMVMLASRFSLTQEQAEIFCEAGNCYFDKSHVMRHLRKGKIDLGQAIDQLILMEQPSRRAFAEAQGVNPSTAMGWTNGYVPREILLHLSEGMDLPDKRFLLEQGSYYLDAEHIDIAFRESNRLDNLILAIKSTYGMTNHDFGVHESTLRTHYHAEQDPGFNTLVREFISVEKLHPEFHDCWDTFKRVSARFLGITTYAPAYIDFNRGMEREYKAQTAGADAGAGFVQKITEEKPREGKSPD